MMENSPTTIAPLLLRNLFTTLFMYADKPLLSLSQKYKLLHLLRRLLIAAFLLLLRLLPSLFPSLDPSLETYSDYYPFKPQKIDDYVSSTGGSISGSGGGGADGSASGIGRSLLQLLSIVNTIPVSSRKYEVVRSLAERVIDENLHEGSEALREVNCVVLSAAFSRTLSQLEAAVLDRDVNHGDPSGDVTSGTQQGEGRENRKVNRVLRAVRYYKDVAARFRKKSRVESSQTGSSAEKLAAEVLWLAQKMAACGCVEVAVCKWASATHLAWLALSAEPRLQGSLVKVSAFLIRQARELGTEERGGDQSSKETEQQMQTKVKMLMSWLPLLCRASNGVDAPVMSAAERAELERVIEETIEMLEGGAEEQEKVLSLWLHHFALCPSSDWPNLRGCYARWCSAARRLFLLQSNIMA